ncbi:hypothetical protein BDW02DRAFT_614210 [Decorospora gaudefroyi]|uniref:Major facilitator superfamily (MFS) profile domain-containing protein n=1 Tax=Decorospora gaudefroyi TaxID=184978 RepID=A0A6A5K2V3_9PLEO|nr:hypothetical protein BDW02DRAFT_614210 [Decorospora gaudefroyi]
MMEQAQGTSAGWGTVGDRKLAAGHVRSTGARQTIDNPFLTFDDARIEPDIGRTELEEYVWQFALLASLKDRYELLRFGARLARDKHEAMSRYADELTDPEKRLLETEKNKETGFWKQSKFFRATILTASLAGMIQGWTQSTNNGTLYGIPDEFNLCHGGDDCASSDMWTLAMLSAIPLFSAGLFGTLIADPLQENFLGRRGSVMLSCVITIASTIGASVTHSVGQLAACRAINGIALGAKASIVPIYSAELSPEHIRGAILANWQLADAAGIFFGFLANLIIVTYVSDSSKAWRVLTNTVLIPTIPLLVMIYLMPESPRYLMKHGSYRKALESFEQVQTTSLLASRDFMYVHAQLDFESNPYSYHIGVTGYFKRLVQLWVNKRCRRALLSASVSMISQQMTGVNTIAFLGTIVWEKSIISDTSPNQANSARDAAIIGVAFGAANYIFGLPAYWLSDKVGRSIMLALGLPNMAWSMLVFAFLFKIPNDSSIRIPMLSIFAIVFVAIYAPTAGTSPFSISAEVFPMVSREAGMAVSVAVNLLGASILVFIFPYAMDSIGMTGAFSIFAGLNLVAFVLVYLFVPETRMRTLEELQYTFDLPTRWHVVYRMSHVREHIRDNWWRYVTRQHVEPPIPFYEWARVTYQETKDVN